LAFAEENAEVKRRKMAKKMEGMALEGSIFGRVVKSLE